MRIADLIGCQLVSLDNEKIVVKKDDNLYTLRIDEDEGGCCGYNEIETSLFISAEELNRNPIITNIAMEVKDDEADFWHDGERCQVTFYGELKPMAELNTLSSSGSGWCYGATVHLVCDALELNEKLSSW